MTDYSGREYINTERGYLVSIKGRVGDSYQYRTYNPRTDEINTGCILKVMLDRAIADGVYVRATTAALSADNVTDER